MLCSLFPFDRGRAVTWFTDRSGQTGGLRYRYTEPIWLETGPNRSKSNLNLKFSVQTVRIGVPVGLTGLPVSLTGNRSV